MWWVKLIRKTDNGYALKQNDNVRIELKSL